MRRETRNEVAIFVALVGLLVITLGHLALWQAIVAVASSWIAYGFHSSARGRRK